jgi:predicted DNA-binding helix-hairpin-helix protein
VNEDKNLPALLTSKPPLLREHRLYQADWLLRFYDFSYDEIVNVDNPNLDEELDPKMFWALNNLHLFPMEINKATKEELIRIPGIGTKGAMKIINARRFKKLTFDSLKQLKISLKNAKYFITCNGVYQKEIPMYSDTIKIALKPPKLITAPNLFDVDYSVITGEL